MLQTIQEFAEAILRQSGEWEDAAAAYAGFFARLAKEAHGHYRADEVAVWFARLERE